MQTGPDLKKPLKLNRGIDAIGILSSCIFSHRNRGARHLATRKQMKGNLVRDIFLWVPKATGCSILLPLATTMPPASAVVNVLQSLVQS